ncbi:ABC transporter permease [Carnobacterium maltaromaticum]|uniref:ABC transporter permease n=1 Tax=Carnobacterium maltaromaticum TaxID=2751 RepID=UPI00295E788C|nr:ABC transporter permease [Carnobacterium maltaromaticum]
MNFFRTVFSSFKIQLTSSLYRSVFVTCILVNPMFYVFLLYMMYSSKNENIGNIIILGSGLTTIWSSICFSSAGDIERERRGGTLEYLFASPSNFNLIYLGKVLANTLLSISGFIISFIIATFILNEPPVLANPIYFTISFILTIFSFITFSLFLGPLFTLSRNSRAFINSLDYPIFILCGMVTSLDLLPGSLKIISYSLPPTWGISLLRESANGIEDFSKFFVNSLILILIGLIYILISIVLQRKIDKQARISATLGVF